MHAESNFDATSTKVVSRRPVEPGLDVQCYVMLATLRGYTVNENMCAL